VARWVLFAVRTLISDMAGPERGMKMDEHANAARREAAELRTLFEAQQAALQAARREAAELRIAFDREDGEICQTLGKALGYPWFKDDQKNFPGATEENGVCVGDHVAASIAAEAAKAIARIKREADEMRTLFEAQQLELQAALGREERAREALQTAERVIVAQSITLGDLLAMGSPTEFVGDFSLKKLRANVDAAIEKIRAALQKGEMVMIDANELVEKVAREICIAEGSDPDGTLDGAPMWQSYELAARAAARAAIRLVIEECAEVTSALAAQRKKEQGTD